MIALSALYESDITGEDSVDKLLSDALSVLGYQLDTSSMDFARNLIETVAENKSYLDALIIANLENWELERVNPVDRNILRLCVAELVYFPDIPTNSSIDEAIELAKDYGSQDSWRFVNGVLDGILKEIKQKGKV